MPSKSTSQFPFNPAVFRWARNRADFSQIEVAEKMNYPLQKVEAWETGLATPTIIQARKLAELYGRPFLEFFAKTVPDIPETQLVPDFRAHHNALVNHEDKLLKDIQAWGETQRLNTIDLFEINGEPVPIIPKELKATIKDNPETTAGLARQVLNLSIQQQLSLRSNQKGSFVKLIKARLEEIGVLILKNTGLGKCNARGLCIYNEIVPIIILSKEAPNGSAFTLCHELGHIILGQSAVSDGMQKHRQVNAIEAWCNSFAGAFLMPSTYVRNFYNISKPQPSISESELTSLANKFAVSRHAMLVRLVQLNLIESDYYWNVKRPEFLEEEKNQKPGFGRSYYGSRFRNRNGDLYTGLVLEAWANNRITNHNAAEYMGIDNLAHLFDIRKHFND